ncbi:MAG: right-handed parallel beta-helix repeat-containing protein [Chloroflexi bacterium]|nr:right-handed parallel beta-helix repeat-containing protein [Chloroflexota bacterium]
MFASNVTHTNQRAIGFLVALTVLLTPLLSTASGNVRAAPAYTEVGGPIVSDTTWTLANSPYIVVANVEVWQGVTLTIQPGVVIKFQDGKLLQVNGTLVARGTESQRIVFTSAKASPRQGDWGSIYFTDSSVDATFDIGGSYISGSVLQYCTAEYAGQNAESVIHAPSAAPYLDHCMVRNNSSRGIKATGTADHHVIITSNVVSGNSAYFGGGISADNSTVTGNTVSGNSATSGFLGGGGIYAYNSTVTGNTVSGNSASYDGGGIYASRSTVTGNTVSGNSASHDGGGIYASDSTVTGNTVSGNSTPHYGGGIFADNSTVAGNTVSGNSTSYLGGGIYASKGTVTSNTVSGNSASNGGGIDAGSSTLTGNIVSGNSASYGGGGISAGGSTVTGNTVSGNSTYWGGGGGISVVNSTVASNTVSGNSARNDSGGGIYAYNSTVISNTITANRVSAATGQGSGVYFDGSDDFLYNVIVGNTAISPTAVIGGVAINGTPQFHHNNLYGNSNYDVVVLSSGDISGTHNYWGAVATVDILAHVYDWYDNSSRGRLLFIPYIQDPDPNAPVPPPQNLRATFAGGSASLSWDAIPSTTTGYGYKVYYDTDASGPPYHGAGATQGNSPIDVGNATHFTLSGFGSGGIVVTITAYDTQGRESWYSNEVHSPWRNYLPAVLKR